jgi:hypothetical protein
LTTEFKTGIIKTITYIYLRKNMTKQNVEPLTQVEANKIYDILIQHAGAAETKYHREQFVFSQMSEVQPEYRFMGALGFGGKFRRNSRDDTWFVNCYPEDSDSFKRDAIEKTNEALKLYQNS